MARQFVPSRATATSPRTFQAELDKLSHDGRGLGREPGRGKTLFAEGGLPGEKVVVRTLKEHGRFVETVVTDVLTPSEWRSAPLCPHYATCGGCNLQHLLPARQLAFKESAVLEQLQRLAGVRPETLLPSIASPSLAYRSRARLGVVHGRNGAALGFRQRNSHALVTVEQCPVLVQALQDLITPLNHWLVGVKPQKAITEVELLADDAVPAAIIRLQADLDDTSLTGLEQLAQTHDCQIWLQSCKPQSRKRPAAPPTGRLKTLAGEYCDPRLSYRLADFDLQLHYHPHDFTQVNRLVNARMVKQAVDLLAPKSNEVVLDLFCGIGNFTLPLARRAGRVIGVEVAADMVARGRENSNRQGLENTRFEALNLEPWNEEQAYEHTTESALFWQQPHLETVAAVLLDPPRAGARGAITRLAELAPARVVYISCNPATLARDAGLLLERGYRLSTLGVLDMFPQTAHIESMALFERV